MNATEQVQLAVAHDAPLREVAARIADLLSENILTLAGLAVVGMLAGVAMTGVVRLLFLPQYPHAAALERRLRARQYAIVACVFGFAWTALATAIYTAAYISDLPMVVGLAISANAPIAAAGTPLFYDLARWLQRSAAPAIGRALIEGIRKYGSMVVGGIMSIFKGKADRDGK